MKGLIVKDLFFILFFYGLLPVFSLAFASMVPSMV